MLVAVEPRSDMEGRNKGDKSSLFLQGWLVYNDYIVFHCIPIILSLSSHYIPITYSHVKR